MAKDRFVNNALSELEEANSSPIFGYEDSRILSLEEAVEKITPPIFHLTDYVATAKTECNRHSTLLTQDESAAIYLYTMETACFSRLTETLRAESRQALKPWFAFLKLFITALEKLPSTRKTVWRGVSGAVGTVFDNGDVHIWWSVNSCSMNPKIVEALLGNKGTLFAIDAIDAKDISAFSKFPEQQEIVLMPGTRLRAKCGSLNFESGFFCVHLEEENLQNKSQSESNYLFEQIKQQYQRNNHIERFMNPSKSFPIGQSYINLAIVKVEEQHDKEKQLRDAQRDHANMFTFEEIYCMQTAIDVKDIFETCKNQDKQVLVLGGAGIGKSTFCRYVAYKWATGSYWPQYELLALIPLRHLTADRYPSNQEHTLIDLVKKEVLQYDLTEKDEILLKEQFDAKRTLWILDGYDEIVNNVPPHLECLFEQLLKTPHHILTSHPYLNTLSYDVQMEITGFTDENIVKYVQQFFNQINDELDDASTKIEKLLKLLKSNRRIWTVAHIPINLELICSLLHNEDWSETKQLTLTTLYSMMTEWLCRHYLRTQYNEILDQCYQKELSFLESLAFNAIESNTIIIRPFILKKALVEANVSLKESSHLLNIGILKSFNKQGTGTQIETDKDHYFVRLSFQEYFAARYLVTALKGSQTEKAIAFIKHQKYNQQYTSVFTFAAGLLSETNPEPCLHTFWNNILGEPLDLLGIRQMQLVMFCIDESSDKSIAPRRTTLLKLMAECIKYNFSKQNQNIQTHLSQLLRRVQSVACDQIIINAFIELLQHHDTNIKLKTISFISRLELSNPSVTLVTSLATRSTDENEDVRESACRALVEIAEKAAMNEVISKLVCALGDKSSMIRYCASKALRNIAERVATNEVNTELASALGDQNETIRSGACEALGEIGEKVATNEVITMLASALEDQSENVRSGACKALGTIGEKVAMNDVISKLVSALGDQSISVSIGAQDALSTIARKAVGNEMISKLTSALGDQDANVRWRTCQVLREIVGKAGTNEVITKLVSTLEDQNEYVRERACELLGEIGEKAATNEVITKLASALGDQSRCVRWSASKTLGKMGQKAATNEVITKLVSALGGQSVHVRESACEALGKIGENAATNEVISKLASALEDPSVDVRESACKALGEMGEKAATNEVCSKLVSALGDQRTMVTSNASEALRKIGEKATTNEVISKLASGLGDQSVEVRWRVCKVLGEIGEKAATNEVITMLVSALGDQSEYVRGWVCQALGDLGEKGATNEMITKLVSALEDTSENVIVKACGALGEIGEKAGTDEVINKLVNALGAQSSTIRYCASEALRKIGEKSATNKVVSKLGNALEDQSECIRESACEVLGEIGEKMATNEVISKLVNALEDQSECIRERACEALGKIGEKAATNEVVSKLVNALEDQSECVREGACEALGKIGEKAATNEVITKLLSALTNQSESVRTTACNVLGKMGEKAATNEVISKLASALGDQSVYVRESACETLKKMGEKAATNEVITQLVNALGDQSKSVRRWALRDKTKSFRENACEVLGNIGEKAAMSEVIRKLMAIYDDDDFSTSIAAITAIEKILSSPALIIQLGHKMISDLCLWNSKLECLENVSVDDLIKQFFTTGDSNWLSVAIDFTRVRGWAVSVIEDAVLVCGAKEPLELPIPSSKLREQIIVAFRNEAKRLHLSFEMPSEIQNDS